MQSILRRLLRRRSRTVTLSQGRSYHAPDLSLVISSGGVWHVPNPKGAPYRKVKEDTVDLVIGAPGLPNIKRALQLGDAVLYQTPNYGVVEIRVVEVAAPVKLLITEVSPRRAFGVTYESGVHDNSSFALDEVEKVKNGLLSVTEKMSARKDITPEQMALLGQKLAEIADAAQRLGRKDWIMFTAGTITNVVVGAAFAPEAARALFAALNGELSWIFQNALRLAGA